jgi:glutamine amidotransferase-like uncharacterized protein
MKVRRKLAAALVLTGTVAGLNVALESAAHADCSPSGISISTTRYGNWIEGAASMPTCAGFGYQSHLVLQRWSWFAWREVASGTMYSGGALYFVDYDCSGTGNYDYRTIATGTTVGTGSYVVPSNQINATC